MTSFGEENVRAKEFLPDLIANTPTAVMHKDSVKRLVTSGTCPFIVSAGYDGLAKALETAGRSARVILLLLPVTPNLTDE